MNVTDKEYRGLVADLCRQITNSDWRPDYVAGLTRNGVNLAVMISYYFNIPMHALNPDESNLWMAEDAFGYSEPAKQILIVNDINQGNVFDWLVQDWESGCLPGDPRWNTVWNNNIRFAVLIDDVNAKSNIKVDYCSIEQPGPIDVILPYEQWWK